MDTTPSATLSLSCELIREQSVTPDDANCQAILCQRLQNIGFEITPLHFGQGSEQVKNFWAARRGGDGPTLAFAGHTDVVPTGPAEQWSHPPFEPTIENYLLYGRGSADMKSSLAAMVVACEEFVAKHPAYPGTIAFLITSDEEGPAIHGTVKVVEWLHENNIPLEYCIVGEPSSQHQFGDMIKNGRRGSLNGKLTIQGKQGHIAYPHLANNPIHLSAPILAELCAIQWDQGNEHFPPTSFQISNITAGTGTTNVIPGELECLFNFRYSTEVTAEQLKAQAEKVINAHGVEFSIDWTLSGEPFLTPKGELLDALTKSITQHTGLTPEISTTGGTSDGRFIATLGTQVVECGPCNKTIHQIDECVDVKSLDTLKDVYRDCLFNLFLS